MTDNRFLRLYPLDRALLPTPLCFAQPHVPISTIVVLSQVDVAEELQPRCGAPLVAAVQFGAAMDSRPIGPVLSLVIDPMTVLAVSSREAIADGSVVVVMVDTRSGRSTQLATTS